MELIRRTFGWTPPNLVAAFLVASFGSAYLLSLLVVIASGFYEPWWDFLVYVLIAPVLGALLLGLVMAFGLAIFGVGPTWLLRRFHSAWWMWLVALGWGASAGLLFVFVEPHDSDGGGPMILPEVLAIDGALCGVIWWLLARRVLRRDAMLEAGDQSAILEKYV